MDDDNFATVLECYVTISSLCIAQVNTKKVLMFNHLVLSSGVFHPRKHLKQSGILLSMVPTQC